MPIPMQPTNNIGDLERARERDNNARLPVLIRVCPVLPLCPLGLATELRIFAIFGFLSIIEKREGERSDSTGGGYYIHTLLPVVVVSL